MPRQNSQIDADLQNHKDDGSAGPGVRRLLAGDVAAGVATHREDSPVPTKMPHVDTGNGSVMAGADDHPRFTFPPFAIFDHPILYALRVIDTVSAIIPGNGNRAMFNRLIANPPAPTTERFWGAQGSADVKAGCPANFNCGVPGHGDLTGIEGTVVHEGTGLIELAVGLMGYVFIGGAGVGSHIVEAISNYAFQPQAGSATATIDRAYCFKAKVRPGPGTVVKKFSFVSEDGCGPAGIGYDQPEAMLAVNGGIHAGGVSDPGAGKIQGAFVSSDSSVGASGSFTSLDGKTITVKDGIIVSIV